MPNVLIVNGNPEYQRMFEDEGWDVMNYSGKPGLALDMALKSCDLVQFTGGEDVDPALYGQRNVASGCNLSRDLMEIEVFSLALHSGKPMAGICRGGQFLNVMCGGKMWQDVNNHLGTHLIEDIETGELFAATSTHHQMMRPGDWGCTVVGIGHGSEVYDGRGVATTRLDAYQEIESAAIDFEILYYDRQDVLCFQPHPEFYGKTDLADRYFSYLLKYLGVVA